MQGAEGTSVEPVTPDEVKKAFEVADAKTSRVTVEEPKPRSPKGRKEKALGLRRNSPVRPPLDGANQKQSDAIRSLVACRFAGFTFEEACKQTGIALGTGYTYERTLPEAFAEAVDDHLTRALQEYQKNLWIARTALSELGPKALRVLDQVMSNRKTAPGVRAKAAIAILKMLDVDNSATGGTSESVSTTVMNLLRGATERLQKESEYVVDVVAEDTTDEDDDGD